MLALGKRVFSSASWRYSGRKSCPHWLMQCASSIAKLATFKRARQLEKSRRQQPLRRDEDKMMPAAGDLALDVANLRRSPCRYAAPPPDNPTAAAHRPGLSSARSAARRRRRCVRRPQAAPGSRATCRPRSASRPASRGDRARRWIASRCSGRKLSNPQNRRTVARTASDEAAVWSGAEGVPSSVTSSAFVV